MVAEVSDRVREHVVHSVCILHGTKGSADANWYPWLDTSLRAQSVHVCRPRFPTPDGQSLESWVAAFAAQYGQLREDTILVGHSCGAALALRLLERTAVRITATVLVAPLSGEIGIPEFDRLNSTFITDPFDWERIRQRAGRIEVYMGDLDQYVPHEQQLSIAAHLDVRPLLLPGGGHLNAETGYTTFPELLTLIQQINAGEPSVSRWNNSVIR